jgi:3-methylfumaryl-CoA hydratase
LLTVLGEREMRLKTPPACSRREAAIQIFAQRHLSIGVGMIDSELVLPDWRHAEQVAEDEASLPLFRRLAALLDSDPSSIGDGDAVPLPWTAILFPTLARQGEIGADGHAKHGSFLPVMPLPKRMFAGRTVEQFRPVRIGDRVRRLSTIADVVQKTGRSGPLIFVTILHKITGEEGPYYSERQEVVFREDRPDTPRTATPEAMPSPRWQSRFSPDPVMLFRYSALTFNGHRIHYDAPYATGVEGYPGLVVNGGLTALMLLQFAGASLGASPCRYHVRAMRPLFAGTEILLNGTETDEGALFWATDASGSPAMKIKIGKCV